MMSTEAQKHAEHAERFLDHADDMVARRDRLQASEKIWGSVAHTLKEIAERRGWKNETHEDLAQIARYLSDATGDKTITAEFQRARAFHTNFYEDEFPMADIKDGVGVAGRLVPRLRAADQRVRAGARPASGAKTPLEHHQHTEGTVMSRDVAALRRQGLPIGQATAAARVVQRARSPRGDINDLSFTVGEDGRRVALDNRGKLKVDPPRRDTGPKLKKVGPFKMPNITVRYGRRKH